MRWTETQVSLKLGTLRGPLTLKRVPRFLRFVVTGTDWTTLDALDQLDDTPREGEHVIAAEKRDESSVHLDGYKNGRRCGWWERTATYEPVPDPPPQDVLRDTAKWQAWCVERLAKEKA
jgi:hypothetical protein